MPFRRKHPQKIPAGGEQTSRPVSRDYVEEIQKRAEKLGKTRATGQRPVTGDDFARRQQEHIERHMARMRSEAVQARHLAQHIDQLSQDVAVHKRNRAMSDSTTVDPGQSQRQQRRSGDKPRAATKTSSFNPLHPSMELPPEELIRLLGMESKKLRKQRKQSEKPSHKPGKSAQTAAFTPEDGLASLTGASPRTESERAPSNGGKRRARQSSRAQAADSRRRRMEAEALGRSGRKLLVPALAVGLVCGIALSAYLFWWQPSPGPGAADGKPATVKAADSPKPATAKKPVSRPPANKPAATGKPAAIDNPAWQAATRAQAERLRAAAKQRLEERISTQQAAPVTAPVTAPVDAPAALAEPPVASQPATGLATPTPVDDIPAPVPADSAPVAAPQPGATATLPATTDSMPDSGEAIADPAPESALMPPPAAAPDAAVMDNADSIESPNEGTIQRSVEPQTATDLPEETHPQAVVPDPQAAAGNPALL